MNYTDNEIAQEQWRDIAGYNGMYQVSDLGRVRSRKSGEWKVMMPVKNSKCYLQVGLCKDGKKKQPLVHRLVAQAFIQNSDESKTQINHINECKSDNRVSNLEYCTAQYNLTYNDLRRRCGEHNCKQNKIKELYDENLSTKENLAILKANGLDCSTVTLWKVRKDLGLVRKHKPTKSN